MLNEITAVGKLYWLGTLTFNKFDIKTQTMGSPGKQIISALSSPLLDDSVWIKGGLLREEGG